MKLKEFFNYDHAVQGLQRSVVRLKKEPIYINQVLPGRKKMYGLEYRVLGSDKALKTCDFDEDINLKPVPLGLVNWVPSRNDRIKFTGVCYASRIPERAWKIGLCSHNLAVLVPTNRHLLMPAGEVLLSGHLRNTILRNYPSLKKCFAVLDADKLPTVAFSPRFFLNKKRELFYKMVGQPVGRWENDSWILEDSFRYLSEVLEEDTKA